MSKQDLAILAQVLLGRTEHPQPERVDLGSGLCVRFAVLFGRHDGIHIPLDSGKDVAEHVALGLLDRAAVLMLGLLDRLLVVVLKDAALGLEGGIALLDHGLERGLVGLLGEGGVVREEAEDEGHGCRLCLLLLERLCLLR